MTVNETFTRTLKRRDCSLGQVEFCDHIGLVQKISCRHKVAANAFDASKK